MEISFSGKRALVTGGGRGIGRAVAKALLTCGAVTYALDKEQQRLDSLKEEFPDVKIICVDLADWDATKAAIEALGHIDLLVNVAGIAVYEDSFFDCKPEVFDNIFQVNVKAMINVSQVVAKEMIAKKNGGAIVNVSSQVAEKPLKGLLSYSASKSAVDQVTRAMALELGPHKIRVNSVNPTAVNTELVKETFLATEAGRKEYEQFVARIPLGRIVEPSELADTIMFLLSDKTAMVHGHNLWVDGGYRIS